MWLRWADIVATEVKVRVQAAGNQRGTDGGDVTAIDVTYLERHREWSRATFGPGTRAMGLVDHIRKELAEIEAAPGDLGEWVDVIILAIDGAWRSGAKPADIIAAPRRSRPATRPAPGRTGGPARPTRRSRTSDDRGVASRRRRPGDVRGEQPRACPERPLIVEFADGHSRRYRGRVIK